MAKPKLGPERHRELGRRLSEMQFVLTKLVTELDSYQGGRPCALAAQRVVGRLSELRSRLDSQLARDYPEVFSPSIYYSSDHRAA